MTPMDIISMYKNSNIGQDQRTKNSTREFGFMKKLKFVKLKIKLTIKKIDL